MVLFCFAFLLEIHFHLASWCNMVHPSTRYEVIDMKSSNYSDHAGRHFRIRRKSWNDHQKWLSVFAWAKNPWERESADVSLCVCDWGLWYWGHNSKCEAIQKSNYRSMNWKFGPWAKADRLVKELVSKQPINILRCRLFFIQSWFTWEHAT